MRLIEANPAITQTMIMEELDLTRKQVQNDMKELQEKHVLVREGTNRNGQWIIVDK
ncbi:MAG: HTH domain-containing protein [Oscillospiraceae bacterium]|nr:HTH domain-containing protein [Oscillospiraceae bacterium]